MATFNIADLVPNFDLGMNEEGELNFNESNTPPADGEVTTDKKPATSELTDAKADVKTGTPETSSDKGPSVPAGEKVDWEKRYKDLQSDHTRKSQALSEVQELKGQVQALKDLVAGKQTPSAEQTDEDLLDALADRERAPGVLKDLIQKGISEAMSQTPEAKIQREFDETAAKFPDFKEQVPTIAQLSRELSGQGVSLSFEQLYALSKLVPKDAGTTQPKTEATASKPQADGMSVDDAAKLKAKAASLSTESGVAANPETKTRISSVKAALNAALEELGY